MKEIIAWVLRLYLITQHVLKPWKCLSIFYDCVEGSSYAYAIISKVILLSRVWAVSRDWRGQDWHVPPSLANGRGRLCWLVTAAVGPLQAVTLQQQQRTCSTHPCHYTIIMDLIFCTMSLLLHITIQASLINCGLITNIQQTKTINT